VISIVCSPVFWSREIRASLMDVGTMLLMFCKPSRGPTSTTLTELELKFRGMIRLGACDFSRSLEWLVTRENTQRLFRRPLETQSKPSKPRVHISPFHNAIYAVHTVIPVPTVQNSDRDLNGNPDHARNTEREPCKTCFGSCRYLMIFEIDPRPGM
jgi:hypothetical protein